MMVVSMVIGYISSLAHIGISPMGGGMKGAGAIAGIIIAPINRTDFQFHSSRNPFCYLEDYGLSGEL
ncbi:MAG TPA: hypothetical protein DD713_07575 [Nitrospiraceae bacterium]|nr:hypothetical protein [Nitrospiraceae bacterium]